MIQAAIFSLILISQVPYGLPFPSDTVTPELILPPMHGDIKEKVTPPAIFYLPPNAAPTGFIIRNTGSAAITDPRLIINGKKMPLSTDELLEMLQPDVLKNLQKYRYHWRPPFSHRWMTPLEHLLFYGYGDCGQIAATYVDIMKLAGVKNACIVGLHGHMVAEINNTLHDPDTGINYEASLKEIEAHPEIVWEHSSLMKYEQLSYHPALIAQLYKTSEDNSIGCFRKAKNEAISFSLPPGKELEFFYIGYYLAKEKIHPRKLMVSVDYGHQPPAFGVIRTDVKLPFPEFEPGVYQINPFILPIPKAGENRIKFEGEGSVEIEIRYIQLK